MLGDGHIDKGQAAFGKGLPQGQHERHRVVQAALELDGLAHSPADALVSEDLQHAGRIGGAQHGAQDQRGGYDDEEG